MDSELFDSKELSKKHKDQRDSARVERDEALVERDSARLERDNLIGHTDDLEKDKLIQELFIATLSHDLRNPIGAIKMAIQLLRGGPDSKLADELINLIDRNADQAEELIKQLLDAHLVKSGTKLPLEIGRCNLRSVLQKCYDSMPPQDQLKLVLNSNDEIWGLWDPRALERAFKNIINNALKFSATDTTVQIQITQGPEMTRIAFQNFGEVIPPESLARIFDGQFNSSRNRTNSKAGWGLGLTLVRGIVDAHHGKVKVTSSESEGSIFTIDLPNDSRAPELTEASTRIGH